MAHGTILEVLYVCEAFLNSPTDGSDDDMSDDESGLPDGRGSDRCCSSSGADGDGDNESSSRERSRSPRAGGGVGGAPTAGMHATGLGLATLLFPTRVAATAAASRQDAAWGLSPLPMLGPDLLSLLLFAGALLLFGAALTFLLQGRVGNFPRSKGFPSHLRRSGFGRAGHCIQHRALSEPSGHTSSDQARIDTLRSLTRALGGPWQTHQPIFAQAFVQPALEVEEPLVEERVFERSVSCVILKRDFDPEFAVVDLSLPATQEELIDRLQLLRDARIRERYPSLLPVLPQPCIGTATFIATPEWQHTPGVCFDTSRFDNRVFVAAPPAYANRAELIACACLPARLGLEVWVGLDTDCLRGDTRVHMPPGAAVWFLPEGELPPLPYTIGQLLLSRDLWSADSVVPVAEIDGAICLVRFDGSQLHVPESSEPGRYRRGLVEATGASPSGMRLYAANPVPRDVACDGIPCSAVVAVADGLALEPAAVWSLALLDCRHLEQGWRAIYVLDGSCDALAASRALALEAPAGWQVAFVEEVPLSGLLPARPGQVFTLLFVQAPNLTMPTYGLVDAAPDVAPPVLPSAETGQTADAAVHPTSSASGTAAPTEDVSTSSDARGSGAVATGGQLVHFLLFSHEYQPEAVPVRMVFPVSVEDALASVAAVRDAAGARRFPRLVPVHFQPPLAYACLLAVPDWAFAGIPVLVACYVPPVRFFAAVVPAVLTVEAIARIACIPAWVHIRVLVSNTPWAFLAGDRCRVSEGDLVAVYLEDRYWSPPIALSSTLASGRGWPEDPVVPGPGVDSDWLLTDHTSRSFMRQPGSIVPLRVAIAELWNLDEERITFLPSTPMIQDHARGGIPSGRVFLALQDFVGENVPFVLDLRSLLLDIEWASAPGGRVDVASICSRIAARCPPGRFVRLIGGSSPPGMANHVRRVFPGQVLWAAFWQRRGGGYVGPADGNDGAPPRDEPGPDEDSEPDTDIPGESVDSASSRADAGTGSTQARQCCRQGGRSADSVAMWGSVSRQDVFREGRPTLTPGPEFGKELRLRRTPPKPVADYRGQGLMCSTWRVFCHLIAGVCLVLLWSLQRAHQACRGKRAVCLLLLLFALRSVATGVHIRELVDCEGEGIAGGRDRAVYASVHRIPRPLLCRQAAAHVPLGREVSGDDAAWTIHGPVASPSSGEDVCQGSLRTLLDESVARPDSQAFFLASTLLETLVEHFAQAEAAWIAGEGPGVSKGADAQRPVRELRLDVLIPAGTSEDATAAGPAAPEQFDLTEGQCALPCSDELFDSVCRGADVRQLRGPAHTVDKPWRFQEWVFAGSPGRSRAPGERLILTADGSYCPNTGRAGWAVVVGLAYPPDLLGQFVGCIYGPVPEPARSQAVNAYVAEVWGLVWAGVIALQFPTKGDVLIPADNLSALHGASGAEGMAPTLVCDVLRGIHMGLRTLAGSGVQYCHVAGHAGDCPNELADGLANVGSRGGCRLGPFQFQVEQWIGNEASAARWFPHACLTRQKPAALPCVRDGLMVWQEKQRPPMLSPERLLQPFLRSVPAAPGAALGRTQRVSCRCVSFNALSLLQPEDTAAGRAAGLHGAIGRVALLRKSLRAHEVFLAGVQEARTDQGCCHNEEFARYCSGGTDRRCLGVELWIARSAGWPEHKFAVRHVDPRRLLGRLDFLGSTYNILVGHAPHRGQSVHDREEWWRGTIDLCLAAHDGLEWIVLLDGNCRVGSVVSEKIGAHQADVQDEGGACLHDLVCRLGVWLPATFSHSMVGPGGTFLQKQSQELHRCDFVGCLTVGGHGGCVRGLSPLFQLGTLHLTILQLWQSANLC